MLDAVVTKCIYSRFFKYTQQHMASFTENKLGLTPPNALTGEMHPVTSVLSGCIFSLCGSIINVEIEFYVHKMFRECSIKAIQLQCTCLFDRYFGGIKTSNTNTKIMRFTNLFLFFFCMAHGALECMFFFLQRYVHFKQIVLSVNVVINLDNCRKLLMKMTAIDFNEIRFLTVCSLRC